MLGPYQYQYAMAQCIVGDDTLTLYKTGQLIVIM